MNTTYSTKLNFGHNCKQSEGNYDRSGTEYCGQNVACKDFPISSYQVNSQRTDVIAIPVTEQNPKEQPDTENNYEVLGMTDKCLQTDAVFLADSQDSNDSNCKLFLNQDLSSNGLECMDP
jgi:hypothetical protein